MAEPQQPTKAEPWWAALPAPRARCPTLPADEVLKLLEENTGTASGASDVLLVDVRRDDWTGGTVAGSVNLPAQSLYATRGAIYDLCRRAGVKRVVFYCGSCSDGGRGWKCANWFQDYVDEKGDTEIQGMLLEGGIKGWVKRFGGKGVQGFDANCWM
ncbi:hypothetical protein MCOR27_004002 [Pyricularia oryzae]|uniref:Rhodanese domain-containing protein n=2 Tax=Pyricularia TaxID=48558 RepID=A0ABQ8P191_PYRGI|nr:uncharacterized protein MGG_15495 [Pyricularia oryzae 70-15]KAH8837778.1 hypothetical protein MCOR01_011380 [Pyricularia oryzae]KAI6305070.1 hypothetical protein MCOR33_000187 [Pyricularia grisea]EHA53485.1 hypothetical protein MGG_15495 [Pyricularia oryzae 70-15]KAH9437523.1 hypothetical protein MCOR02_001180 [Pyricularia oryzae]KAI6256069.1 hypothetical protein MCOR19_007438 [Pyricularia oryzae]